MLDDIITNIVLGSVGTGFMLAIVSRVIPNEKLYKIGFSFGAKVTKWGEGKCGAKVWRKTEGFFQNSAGFLIKGLNDGLDSDDKKRSATLSCLISVFCALSFYFCFRG